MKEGKGLELEPEVL